MKKPPLAMGVACLSLALTACNSASENNKMSDETAAMEGGGAYPADAGTGTGAVSLEPSTSSAAPKGAPGARDGQGTVGGQEPATAARAGAMSSSSGTPGSEGNSNDTGSNND